MDENKIKENFFAKMHQKIDEKKFNIWIKNLKLKLEGNKFILLAKSKYAKNWLEKEYKNYFLEFIKNINSDKNYELKIEFLKKNSYLKADFKKSEIRKISSSKKDIKKIDLKKTNLLLDYTFERFVKGSSNEMAFDAAQIIVKDPGEIYNPLYIYGETALGKTHLMNAIGHKILELNPKASVYFISSERFSQEMVNAINKKKMEEFKEKYRNLDILLIDDVQFFLGKDKTMAEFFFIFNTLLERKNQIVLTSDVHPNNSSLELESRTKSRLSKGLSVAITPPDFETRKEILLKKALDKKVFLPDEVASYLAKKIESHVRDLEGALNKVIAGATFKSEALSIELVNRELKDLFEIKKSQISIDNIQKLVADYFKITMRELLGKSRKQSITRPRQIAMTLAREFTNKSLPEIGQNFEGKDHTTVLNAIKRVNKLKSENKDFKEDWEILKRKLRN